MDTNPPPLCTFKKIGALLATMLLSLSMIGGASAAETVEQASEQSDLVAWIVMVVSAVVILAFVCIVGRKRNRKRYKR
jgi:uncharacterized membrane protein YcjF (UPF0283 family)